VTFAQRGIATTAAQGHRHLRQTFQLSQDINVAQIIFGVDIENPTAGLQLKFYEVADVSAAWNPGSLVKELTFPTLVDSTNWLGINFTGGDVFSLPARATGTTGYGIEYADNTEIVGTTLGQLRMTNDGMSHYAGGQYYSESAGFATRDTGLILVASTETPCDPGDVNCDTDVNEIDLGIIAAHFRQNGAREDGDLTGNGFIDFDDFDQWKKNFLGAGGGAGSIGGVPEPASALLVACGAAGLLSLTGQRRRSN
jgi:hypothetical protein